MLKKTTAWIASDGKAYGSLEEAQAVEIKELVPTINLDMAKQFVAQAAKVLDILTTNEASRPAARKVNGGTKKRKPPVAATPDLLPPPTVDAGRAA